MISFFSSFHISQCKKYRDQFTDQQKLIYEEKLEASELFKDKKALYPSRYYGFTLPVKINILKKFLKCICRHFLVGFDFSDTRIFNFMNYFEIGWICCSVAQLCPTLCDPMDCCTPGSPVLHHLPELAQTQVH